MICARLTPDRRIELVESVRTPLRLGLDVFKFGYLQEVTINNLVESIEIFKGHYHRTTVRKSEHTVQVL